jgi:hypothetical protein
MESAIIVWAGAIVWTEISGVLLTTDWIGSKEDEKAWSLVKEPPLLLGARRKEDEVDKEDPRGG